MAWLYFLPNTHRLQTPSPHCIMALLCKVIQFTVKGEFRTGMHSNFIIWIAIANQSLGKSPPVPNLDSAQEAAECIIDPSLYVARPSTNMTIRVVPCMWEKGVGPWLKYFMDRTKDNLITRAVYGRTLHQSLQKCFRYMIVLFSWQVDLFKL